jgi:HAD superfamily hydrolase (TIGR01509 family)
MSFEGPFWSPSLASGILFDWDGVIADTRLDFSRVREKYSGNRDAMLLEDAGALSPGERVALMRDLEELETRGARDARLMPGAGEVLEWFSKRNIPFAVLSRNCRASIETAARAIGVVLPPVTISRDDSAFVKPDPRAAREACGRLGVAPAQTLLVGDYLYDMMGARRAGMRGALVRSDACWEDWDEWLEFRCASMNELFEELSNPSEIVPWEYMDAAGKFEREFLRAVHGLFLRVPADASPSLDAWLAEAASLGVGGFYAPDAIFSPSDWKRNPSLDPACMGMRLADAARDFLSVRWPFARVIRQPEGRIILDAPPNANGLAEFLADAVGAARETGRKAARS